MADKDRKRKDRIEEPEANEDNKDRDLNVAGRVWEAAKEAVGTGNWTNPKEDDEKKADK
jgi:hypothetical protein